MLRKTLLSALNTYLRSADIKDYCPNGLQVEGTNQVNTIVTGVTASEALIDEAISLNADTIIVHHGYFWKGEPAQVVGMKQRRLKKLLSHNINLIAYHLPIDVHPELGNNMQLGKRLQLQNICALEGVFPKGIVMRGELPEALPHSAVKQHLLDNLTPNAVVSVGNKSAIKYLAWCTGGGQSYIDKLPDLTDVDAFISGEISEQTTHSARELGIDFFAAGHHATERYGVKALGEWIKTEYACKVHFIDVPNPA